MMTQGPRERRGCGCFERGCLFALLVIAVAGLVSPVLFFFTPLYGPFRVAHEALADHLGPPPWVTMLSVTTPGRDTMELCERDYGSRDWGYLWRWTTPRGEVHEFSLGVVVFGWHEGGPSFYQFRASPDFQRIWLVDGDTPTGASPRRRVWAVLDLASGSFSLTSESYHSEGEQSSGREGQSPRVPEWATTGGGIVLGQCEGEVGPTGWYWKAEGGFVNPGIPANSASNARWPYPGDTPKQASPSRWLVVLTPQGADA